MWNSFPLPRISLLGASATSTICAITSDWRHLANRVTDDWRRLASADVNKDSVCQGGRTLRIRLITQKQPHLIRHSGICPYRTISLFRTIPKSQRCHDGDDGGNREARKTKQWIGARQTHEFKSMHKTERDLERLWNKTIRYALDTYGLWVLGSEWRWWWWGQLPRLSHPRLCRGREGRLGQGLGL